MSARTRKRHWQTRSIDDNLLQQVASSPKPYTSGDVALSLNNIGYDDVSTVEDVEGYYSTEYAGSLVNENSEDLCNNISDFKIDDIELTDQHELSDDLSEYKCKFCEHLFEHHSDLIKHTTDFHMNEQDRDSGCLGEKPTSSASDNKLVKSCKHRAGSFKCEFCDKVYKYDFDMSRHVKKNHLKDLKRCKGNNLLKNKIKAYVKKNLPYQCKVCGLAFVSERGLSYHTSRVHTASASAKAKCIREISERSKKLLSLIKTGKSNTAARSSIQSPESKEMKVKKAQSKEKVSPKIKRIQPKIPSRGTLVHPSESSSLPSEEKSPRAKTNSAKKSLPIEIIREKNEKRLKCKLCQKMYGTRPGIMYHLKIIHLYCCVCYKQFCYQKMYDKHMELKHNQPHIVIDDNYLSYFSKANNTESVSKAEDIEHDCMDTKEKTSKAQVCTVESSASESAAPCTSSPFHSNTTAVKIPKGTVLSPVKIRLNRLPSDPVSLQNLTNSARYVVVPKTKNIDTGSYKESSNENKSICANNVGSSESGDNVASTPDRNEIDISYKKPVTRAKLGPKSWKEKFKVETNIRDLQGQPGAVSEKTVRSVTGTEKSNIFSVAKTESANRDKTIVRKTRSRPWRTRSGERTNVSVSEVGIENTTPSVKSDCSMDVDNFSQQSVECSMLSSNQKDVKTHSVKQTDISTGQPTVTISIERITRSSIQPAAMESSRSVTKSSSLLDSKCLPASFSDSSFAVVREDSSVEGVGDEDLQSAKSTNLTKRSSRRITRQGFSKHEISHALRTRISESQTCSSQFTLSSRSHSLPSTREDVISESSQLPPSTRNNSLPPLTKKLRTFEPSQFNLLATNSSLPPIMKEKISELAKVNISTRNPSPSPTRKSTCNESSKLDNITTNSSPPKSKKKTTSESSKGKNAVGSPSLRPKRKESPSKLSSFDNSKGYFSPPIPRKNSHSESSKSDNSTGNISPTASKETMPQSSNNSTGSFLQSPTRKDLMSGQSSIISASSFELKPIPSQPTGNGSTYDPPSQSARKEFNDADCKEKDMCTGRKGMLETHSTLHSRSKISFETYNHDIRELMFGKTCNVLDLHVDDQSSPEHHEDLEWKVVHDEKSYDLSKLSLKITRDVKTGARSVKTHKRFFCNLTGLKLKIVRDFSQKKRTVLSDEDQKCHGESELSDTSTYSTPQTVHAVSSIEDLSSDSPSFAISDSDDLASPAKRSTYVPSEECMSSYEGIFSSVRQTRCSNGNDRKTSCLKPDVEAVLKSPASGGLEDQNDTNSQKQIEIVSGNASSQRGILGVDNEHIGIARDTMVNSEGRVQVTDRAMIGPSGDNILDTRSVGRAAVVSVDNGSLSFRKKSCSVEERGDMGEQMKASKSYCQEECQTQHCSGNKNDAWLESSLKSQRKVLEVNQQNCEANKMLALSSFDNLLQHVEERGIPKVVLEKVQSPLTQNETVSDHLVKKRRLTKANKPAPASVKKNRMVYRETLGKITNETTEDSKEHRKIVLKVDEKMSKNFNITVSTKKNSGVDEIDGSRIKSHCLKDLLPLPLTNSDVQNRHGGSNGARSLNVGQSGGNGARTLNVGQSGCNGARTLNVGHNGSNGAAKPLNGDMISKYLLEEFSESDLDLMLNDDSHGGEELVDKNVEVTLSEDGLSATVNRLQSDTINNKFKRKVLKEIIKIIEFASPDKFQTKSKFQNSSSDQDRIGCIRNPRVRGRNHIVNSAQVTEETNITNLNENDTENLQLKNTGTFEGFDKNTDTKESNVLAVMKLKFTDEDCSVCEIGSKNTSTFKASDNYDEQKKSVHSKEMNMNSDQPLHHNLKMTDTYYANIQYCCVLCGMAYRRISSVICHIESSHKERDKHVSLCYRMETMHGGGTVDLTGSQTNKIQSCNTNKMNESETAVQNLLESFQEDVSYNTSEILTKGSVTMYSETQGASVLDEAILYPSEMKELQKQAQDIIVSSSKNVQSQMQDDDIVCSTETQTGSTGYPCHRMTETWNVGQIPGDQDKGQSHEDQRIDHHHQQDHKLSETTSEDPTEEHQRNREKKSEGLESCENIQAEGLESCENIQAEGLESCEDKKPERLESCEDIQPEGLESCENIQAEGLESCENIQPERLESCEDKKPERLESCEDIEPEGLESCEDIEPERLESCEDIQPERLESCEDKKPERLESCEDIQPERLESCEDKKPERLESCEDIEPEGLESCEDIEPERLESCEDKNPELQESELQKAACIFDEKDSTKKLVLETNQDMVFMSETNSPEMVEPNLTFQEEIQNYSHIENDVHQDHHPSKFHAWCKSDDEICEKIINQTGIVIHQNCVVRLSTLPPGELTVGNLVLKPENSGKTIIWKISTVSGITEPSPVTDHVINHKEVAVRPLDHPKEGCKQGKSIIKCPAKSDEGTSKHRFYCELCGLSYANKKGVKRHKINKHSGTEIKSDENYKMRYDEGNSNTADIAKSNFTQIQTITETISRKSNNNSGEDTDTSTVVSEGQADRRKFKVVRTDESSDQESAKQGQPVLQSNHQFDIHLDKSEKIACTQLDKSDNLAGTQQDKSDNAAGTQLDELDSLQAVQQDKLGGLPDILQNKLDGKAEAQQKKFNNQSDIAQDKLDNWPDVLKDEIGAKSVCETNAANSPSVSKASLDFHQGSENRQKGAKHKKERKKTKNKLMKRKVSSESTLSNSAITAFEMAISTPAHSQRKLKKRKLEPQNSSEEPLSKCPSSVQSKSWLDKTAQEEEQCPSHVEESVDTEEVNNGLSNALQINDKEMQSGSESTSPRKTESPKKSNRKSIDKIVQGIIQRQKDKESKNNLKALKPPEVDFPAPFEEILAQSKVKAVKSPEVNESKTLFNESSDLSGVSLKNVKSSTKAVDIFSSLRMGPAVKFGKSFRKVSSPIASSTVEEPQEKYRSPLDRVRAEMPMKFGATQEKKKVGEVSSRSTKQSNKSYLIDILKDIPSIYDCSNEGGSYISPWDNPSMTSQEKSTKISVFSKAEHFSSEVSNEAGVKSNKSAVMDTTVEMSNKQGTTLEISNEGGSIDIYDNSEMHVDTEEQMLMSVEKQDCVPVTTDEHVEEMHHSWTLSEDEKMADDDDNFCEDEIEENSDYECEEKNDRLDECEEKSDRLNNERLDDVDSEDEPNIEEEEEMNKSDDEFRNDDRSVEDTENDIQNSGDEKDKNAYDSDNEKEEEEFDFLPPLKPPMKTPEKSGSDEERDILSIDYDSDEASFLDDVGSVVSKKSFSKRRSLVAVESELEVVENSPVDVSAMDLPNESSVTTSIKQCSIPSVLTPAVVSRAAKIFLTGGGYCYVYLLYGSCRRMNVCRYQHTVPPLEWFYWRGQATILDSREKPNKERAFEVYQLLKTLNVKPLTREAVEVLLKLAVNAWDTDAAFQLFRDLKSTDLINDMTSVMLVRLCSISPQNYTDQLWALFQEILEKNLKLTGDCIDTIVQAFSMRREYTKLLEVLCYSNKVPDYLVPMHILHVLLFTCLKSPKEYLPAISRWAETCNHMLLRQLDPKILTELYGVCVKHKYRVLHSLLEQLTATLLPENQGEPQETTDILTEQDWNGDNVGEGVTTSSDEYKGRQHRIRNMKMQKKMADNMDVLDEPSLARIGAGLLSWCYQEGLWEQGYHLLFVMHQASVYYHKCTGNGAMGTALIAMEICLNTNNPDSALRILERCKGQIMTSENAANVTRILKILFEKLLEKSFTKMAFHVLVIVMEKREQDQTHTDLSGYFNRIVRKSLAISDIHTALGVYKIQKDTDSGKLNGLCLRGLLTACGKHMFDSKYIKEVYESCVTLYRPQTFDMPRSILLSCMMTRVEMYLCISDYLNVLYNIICDSVMEGEHLTMDSFCLKVYVWWEENPLQQMDFPYLTLAPRSRQDVWQMAVHVLQKNIHPPLHGEYNPASNCIFINPESLYSYMQVKDGNGRKQGLNILTNSGGAVPVRGRAWARQTNFSSRGRGQPYR
ncbi:uncharacterized protein LOC132552389 [Ylistrum balloti]|uniref:uncharacterized protein LOC132552389 n=1 Tax=Ylistrum balloti TaxID=509963 RepID=UPI002905D100|nr:uncharacterized protein LOC132552389 [Ylistrum balloti]